ncbi:MAG: hypothetical protein JST82_05280 [Bacteroidetes bacterium]|nr:hypothetical protein [Bacteroidota bacterium]
MAQEKDIEQLFSDFLEKSNKLLDTISQEKADAKTKVEEQRKGKKLGDFVDFISFYTVQTSTVNRSLALAGIAIIWIYIKPKDGQLPHVGAFKIPLLCLVVSLGIDLIQYLFGSIAWTLFYEIKYHKWKRKGYPPEYAHDITAPNYISQPINLLFLAKIILMIVAYYNLFITIYFDYAL